MMEPTIRERPPEASGLEVLTNRAPLIPDLPSKGATVLAGDLDPQGNVSDTGYLPEQRAVIGTMDYISAVDFEMARMVSAGARRRFTADDLDKELGLT